MIDAHAHLTDARFASDLEQVIERAAAAGIERIVTCGEDIASSEAAISLAARHSIVRVAVGLHPHRAAEWNERTAARIRELAARPGVVGIGEIGIDLSGRSAPRDAQERAFSAQVELAASLDLPVTIHVRDAGDAVRSLLDRLPRVRGHVHCYSEGTDEVLDWVRRGLSLSFAGTVTYPGNAALREAIARVPDDRILLETDAPYLAPQPKRGKRNEPAFVADTYAFAAHARGTEVARLARQVAQNAATLFGGRW